MEERNPFEYGRELSLTELVDRETELRAIAATIRNRGKLFVIGPRRYGKTSLLSAAEEAARRDGVIVLRLDAERYETPGELAAAVLTGAVRALQGPLERVLGVLRRAAGRLEPRVTVEGESVSVSVGVSAESGGELPLLAEALDAVERLAAETGREVAVVIDEVQQLVVEHGMAAERQLRSTVQRHRHVAYVFAGSATRLLSEMTGDPGRPFYRLGDRLFVGALPRAEFEAFLERGFRDHGFDPAPGAVARILERAEEVPYNVQRLAHEVWEMARESRWGEERPRIDAALVDQALERIVRREDPAYTQLWTSLTGNRKKALRAVIRVGGEGLLAAEVLRRVRLPASSLRLALADLERAHILRAEPAGGGTRYRLVDPFLAAWLELLP
jgi:AAA+ ATPase superfamily predicted ATPase